MLIFIGLIAAIIFLILAGTLFVNSSDGLGIVGGLVLTVLAILFGVGAFYWGPQYNVYLAEMSGRAEYSEAEQNRRIAVLKAQATLDSAKLDAQAEVARANGTKQANDILVGSLGGPENYLRWRYIQMLENNEHSGVQREVIYTPAGGMFPITEAGRAVTAPAPR